MKVIIALCNVLFFASCVGADKNGLGTGTEEAEDRHRFTPSMCPTPDSRLYKIVAKAGNNCLKMAATDETETSPPHQEPQTLQQFRDIFKDFYQKQSLVRSCLAETTVSVEVCRNETFLKTFQIYSGIIETMLNFGSNEDGEQMATLMHELINFVRSKPSNSEHAKECADRFELMFVEIERSDLDMSSKVYHIHKQVVAFFECFHRLEISQSFKDGLRNFMDAIISGMKCIHPRDGTLVLCVTIDASLISVTNVCDLKTKGTEVSLYDVLEDDARGCTIAFIHYLNENAGGYDRIRNIVEIDCKYKVYLPYCYNMSRIISEMCLNDTQQKEFNLLGDFIKSAFEKDCSEDGKRISDIAKEVYRLKRTGHGQAVSDCIDVALSTRNVTDERRSSSKNMRFYHEVEAFKGCLVNKLQGDQTSVAAATSLIDELLKSVKCVHPEIGITVLCETLHNKA